MVFDYDQSPLLSSFCRSYVLRCYLCSHVTNMVF